MPNLIDFTPAVEKRKNKEGLKSLCRIIEWLFCMIRRANLLS